MRGISINERDLLSITAVRMDSKSELGDYKESLSYMFSGTLFYPWLLSKSILDLVWQIIITI